MKCISRASAERGVGLGGSDFAGALRFCAITPMRRRTLTLSVGRNPALRPVRYLAQSVLKLPALFGQLVFNADGCVRDNLTGDKTLGFKRAKSLRQHPVSDVRYRRLDRGIAALPLEEGLQDRASPAATDELDSAVEASADLRNQRIGHEKKLWDLALDTSYLQ